MRIYETTFIVNPQTDDASIDRDVTSVFNLITADGGKIVYENRMGTRRLAYPIQKLTQGYYTTLVYESEPEILPKLERHFKLGETYMRHLTIRFEGDVSKLGQIPEYGAPGEHTRDGRSRDDRPSDEKGVEGRRSEEKPAPEATATEPKVETETTPTTEAPAVTAETETTTTESDVKQADDTAPIATNPPEITEEDEL